MNEGRAVEMLTGSELSAHPGGSPERATGTLGSVGSGAICTSLLQYAPALVLVLIAIADSKRFADPDFWGHIRFGQAVLTLHHLVRHDPYSYSVHGHLWRNHEWLSQVVMALIYNTTGVWGLKLWKFALSAATVLFMVLAVAETGAGASVQLVIMTVSATALAPQMQFRPQLFTFVLLAALMALLARDSYRRQAQLWLTVPMLAVWANLHGGFIIGIAALGIYTAVRITEDWFNGEGFERSRRLVPITIGATLATLATPYGLGTWVTVEEELLNPLSRQVLAEWHPLIASMVETWHQAPGAVIYFACVLGLLAALVVSVARVPSAGDLQLLVIAVVMAAAAFVSMRNMALFVITAAAPIARHAAAALRARAASAAQQISPVGGERRSAVNPFVAIAVAVALCAYTGLFSGSIEGSIPYPDGAVAFMKRNALRGNVLCYYAWGEYLIWHTPDSRVFVDGRYDMVYPLSILRDSVKFDFDLPGASKVLHAYPHDFVLVPPGSGGYRVVSRNAGWKLIYKDGVAAFFARADSSAVAKR